MGQRKFPIISNVVVNGRTFKEQLNKGDVVSCYYCNSHFNVDDDTVVIPNKNDEYHKALRCPECKKIVSVLYYYDRVVRSGKQ